MHTLSWRVKFIGLFTLVLGALLLFQLLYIIPYIRNREVEMAETHQEEITRSIARELDIDLLRIKNRLIRIAERPEFRNMDIAEQHSTMAQHVEISLLLSTLFVMDAQGWFVSGTGDNFSDYTNSSYADRDFFAVPFEEGKAHFSTPLFYNQTKLVVTSISVPIESDKGERVGVLIGSMVLNELIESVQNYPLKEGLAAFLVDREGTVVAHSGIDLFALEQGPLSLSYRDYPLVKDLIAGKEGRSREHEHDDYPYFGTYSILESNGWGVVAESHMMVILAKSGFLTRQLLLVNIALFAVAFAVSLFYTRQITSEHRQADKLLRKSEEKYRLLIENQTDLICKTDPEYHITFASPSYCELFDKKEEELLGKTFLSFIHEEDRESSLKAMEDLYRPPHTVYTEERDLTKHGYRWIGWIDTAVLDENGKVKAIISVGRNITDRKKAEEKLRKREQYFRSILSNIHESILLIDQDYKIVDVNETFLNKTGFMRKKAIGSNCYEIIHGYNKPCDRFGKKCLLQKVFETGKPHSCMHKLKEAEGSTVFTDILLSPMKDEKGSVNLVISARRDVTDLIETKESLRDREEQYHQLVETMNDGLSVLDENFSFSYVNIKFCKMWGYSQEELIGHPATDYLDEANLDIFNNQMKIRKKGRKSSFEITWTVKNGLKLNTIVSPQPIFDSSGRFKGSLAVVTDITKIKEIESETRDLARFPSEDPAPVLRIKDNGIILYANPASKPLLAKWGSEVGGFVPEELKKIAAEVKDSKSTINIEVTFSEKVFNLHLVPVPDGNYINIYGHDMTESRSLEAQLGQSQKLEAIGRLAGGVAHDFNNMMAVVTGYSNLLLADLDKEDPDNEDPDKDDPDNENTIRKSIEEIKKAGDQATTLTQQLLAFSRKQIIQPQVLDLNSVINNIEKMLKRLIGEDISLIVANGPALGRVKADPGQIDQVIINLAVNARDAMPRGGKLTIRTVNIELDEDYAHKHVGVKSGSYVMLAVTDTGCGMNEETQSRIFEPFFTTKEHGTGTGLGLSTVYGIVKQSGGNIWAYSKPGKGTTFKIYLPRLEHAAVSTIQKEDELQAFGGKETILLVEDEDMVRNLARLVLVEKGYTVLEAHDGIEALQIYEQHEEPIHLVLTDVVMPQMDGQDMIEHMTSLDKGVKALYMSGYTEGAIQHHGVLSLGRNFLQKPFTPTVLLHKVRELLDTDLQEQK